MCFWFRCAHTHTHTPTHTHTHVHTHTHPHTHKHTHRKEECVSSFVVLTRTHTHTHKQTHVLLAKELYRTIEVIPFTNWWYFATSEIRYISSATPYKRFIVISYTSTSHFSQMSLTCRLRCPATCFLCPRTTSRLTQNTYNVERTKPKKPPHTVAQFYG